MIKANLSTIQLLILLIVVMAWPVNSFSQSDNDQERYEAYKQIRDKIDYQHLPEAILAAQQFDKMLHETGDSANYYLGTGLKAHIHKKMRSELADSLYQLALKQVGDRNERFKLRCYMDLARVNYMTDPDEALEWAEKAMEEANRTDRIDYKSQAAGLKGYLCFMTGATNEFEETEQYYERLRAIHDSLESKSMAGKDVFNHRYDVAMKVARAAFDHDFKKAYRLVEHPKLNVDRQMVTFRLHELEGQVEEDRSIKWLRRGSIIMALLFLFIYIMGRRRLMIKIWKRQAELKVAQEQAEAANKMKATFIRSMSHEIRTPLNAINGFSQIICSPDYELSEEERMDICKRITSNSEAITLIINELLELAAGESVTFDNSLLAVINVNELGRKAMEKAKEHNERGLAMVFKSDLPDTFTFRSNEATASRILEKILGNALKFTNEGSIEMHVYQTDNMVIYSVTDTGIGIPEDKQNDVFENFVKLDEYKGGVGLGLPICRRLAHSLGGNITLDSSYKKGSRFMLQLPVRE